MQQTVLLCIYLTTGADALNIGIILCDDYCSLCINDTVTVCMPHRNNQCIVLVKASQAAGLVMLILVNWARLA